jgi:hypothetical protein
VSSTTSTTGSFHNLDYGVLDRGGCRIVDHLDHRVFDNRGGVAEQAITVCEGAGTGCEDHDQGNQDARECAFGVHVLVPPKGLHQVMVKRRARM